MPKDFIDFNQKTGFICDMDGVIYHGNRILPGVADFIQWLHEENKEYLFLTNNSGYTPRELQQKRMLHCHSAEAVMVGDRMDTDVISGLESGMSTVLVLSGVSTRQTVETYAYQPNVILDGVGDIARLARKNKK